MEVPDLTIAPSELPAEMARRSRTCIANLSRRTLFVCAARSCWDAKYLLIQFCVCFWLFLKLHSEVTALANIRQSKKIKKKLEARKLPKRARFDGVVFIPVTPRAHFLDAHWAYSSCLYAAPRCAIHKIATRIPLTQSYGRDKKWHFRYDRKTRNEFILHKFLQIKLI